MAINIDGNGLITLGGTASTQGRVRLSEDTDNGTNYIELTAPASVASDKTITFPDATGTVVISGTTPSLNGITFPATQVASADANTLDDYEEGTFTATLKGSSADPSTPVTSTARYTKIGNVVYYQITFDGVNTTGASGNITITALPFTPASGHRYVSAAWSSNMATFTGTIMATIDNSLTTIYFYGISSNASNGAVTHNAGTPRTLHVTGFYFV
jgi:hypothetical protein